jgi:hypothetical protein
MPVFDNSLGAPAAPPLVAGITSSPAPAPAPAPAWQPISVASRDIPAGDRCLAMLDATGTTYKKLSAKNGVETPIEVTSDIGGIRYEPGAGQSLLCDCRFAVALHRVAPVLKSAGVSRVRFSGAYSYRMSRVGRISLHAYGLAMDVHELTVNGTTLAVRRDFKRGLADGCASDAPALNQVACRLKSAGMFRELLTPDFNADHWDHFHLGVEPLQNSPIGTHIAIRPKKPKKPPEKPKPKGEPGDEPVFVPDDEVDDDEPEVVLEPPKKPARDAPKKKPRPKSARTEDAPASEKPQKQTKDEASDDEPRVEEHKPKKKRPKQEARKKKSRNSARAQRTGST